jgi:hypothetical protein
VKAKERGEDELGGLAAGQNSHFGSRNQRGQEDFPGPQGMPARLAYGNQTQLLVVPRCLHQQIAGVTDVASGDLPKPWPT